MSDLKALIKLASQLGRVRINLIPYNSTCNDIFVGSPQSVIEHWHDRLMAAGFTSTIRHSHGQDIAAACGQLANEVESS
ncbi:MAG: putative dual-specificity RNA methyltransferase RlmN [Candidatus Magasanikbacteria bacterium GW2011_GWA2_37_8]|uniref:Putative dual-specificity RNA methyltransferase RlmN n=1 Tax=Candidatus Magasanikbacteria bacterium GW2011_GWA2_37_8 TaxID=1619036 RepID=A0A0G0H865_9BACT|nr:MAG: putative dual-specificity RNA methyltransferase RlmN [Candidatus Magasanikbacteria bacterium GW2011_GWA2_37_8]